MAKVAKAGRGGAAGPSREHYPVIIIGAGPTGLSLANLLGRYGVEFLLVERNATTVQEPRAVSIDDESLRTMQAAGMIDTVLSQVVAGYGSRYLDPKGRCFLEVAPTEILYGYPRRNAFRQPVLEAQLREGLARFPGAATRFGWTLENFVEAVDGVSVRLSGPEGETLTVGCDYLVGCDGSWSTVRTQLGFQLEGETFSEKWLIVDLENSPAPGRDTMVFCDTRRPCIALPGPDETRRFEFKLLPGETPEQILEPAAIEKLLADHGAAASSVIRRKTVYTFHARLAPTWQVGRAFLAGDACHLTPPFAGQGMNSGIRDAHNLAWKLALVVSGRLGPAVLDTYQGERRDHVGEMIKLALRMGRIMGPPSRLAGWATQTFFRTLKAWPAARDYFAQMKYKPKPRFEHGFQIRSPGPLDRLVGRLLTQPKVRTERQAEVLLDSVLGDGFSLLAISNDPGRVEAATDQSIWSRLGARRVVVSRDHAAHRGDCHVVAGDAHDLIGPGFDGEDIVLLVRPDRYVAAAFRLAESQAFAEMVEVLVRSTWKGREAKARVAAPAPRAAPATTSA